MKIQPILLTERLILRPLEQSDCSDNYLKWLSDPEINQYLETRWEEQSLHTIREFVSTINHSDEGFLYGIFDRDGETHIGNIKLGPCNYKHLYADVSYLIGDKQYWGKGLAPEVVREVCDFGFEQLNLQVIQAGVYSGNIASIRVLEKAGFALSGEIKSKLCGPNGRESHLFYVLNVI